MPSISKASKSVVFVLKRTLHWFVLLRYQAITFFFILYKNSTYTQARIYITTHSLPRFSLFRGIDVVLVVSSKYWVSSRALASDESPISYELEAGLLCMLLSLSRQRNEDKTKNRPQTPPIMQKGDIKNVNLYAFTTKSISILYVILPRQLDYLGNPFLLSMKKKERKNIGISKEFNLSIAHDERTNICKA